MSREYTISEMKQKNKAAGHFWFQGRNPKYRAAYGIVQEKKFYDGEDNWIRVTYHGGKETWHHFNPKSGQINNVKAESVPIRIRERK
jgi:hypothetical protein